MEDGGKSYLMGARLQTSIRVSSNEQLVTLRELNAQPHRTEPRFGHPTRIEVLSWIADRPQPDTQSLQLVCTICRCFRLSDTCLRFDAKSDPSPDRYRPMLPLQLANDYSLPTTVA